MTALRAVVRISGQTSAGKATLVTGDATGELRFTPGELTVDIDTTVIPPRVEVGLPAGVSALLQSLLDTESSTGYVGILSHLASLDNYTDALSNDIDGLDDRLTTVENGETCTPVAWASNVVINWANLATRHAKLTADGTNLTLDPPTHMLEGVDYRITLDNLASTGSAYSFDSSAWQIGNPWIVIYPGGLPQFNGDPEIYTFTFRFIGGKMRLIGVQFGNDA